MGALIAGARLSKTYAWTIQLRTGWFVVTLPVSDTAVLVLCAVNIERGGELALLGNPLSQMYCRPW